MIRIAVAVLLVGPALASCNVSSDAGGAAGRGAVGPTATAEPTATATVSSAERPRVTAAAVVGDMGTGSAAQHEVARALCRRAASRPRLRAVVTTGDNVYDSGDPDEFEAKFFSPYRCLFRRDVPFRAALGNHDILTDGGSPMLSKDAFGMNGRRYYRFSLGPIVFVVLDSNSLDDEQFSWLDRVLRRSRGAPWTAVVLHHPPYSSGLQHGSDERVRTQLVPRLERFGVDLVLAGHEHLYSRARMDGITYVVTGGGGAPLYGCSPEPPPEVETCRAVHHFVVLRATRERLRVRALDSEGRLLDTVRLVPRE